MEPDQVTYNIMIQGCCRNGLLKEAEDLLLKMKSASLFPDVVTYNAIVQGILIRGKYDDAAKIFEEMGARGFSPDTATSRLLLSLLGNKEHKDMVSKMIL